MSDDDLRHVALRNARRKAELVARWMDGRFVDPILGFMLPGLGDVGSVCAGVYTVYLARQAGVSKPIQARMLLNLALDGLIGAIPLVGDLFDFVFRAHTRNLELLNQRPDGDSRPGDWVVLGAAGGFLVLALALPIMVAVAFLKWIF